MNQQVDKAEFDFIRLALGKCCTHSFMHNGAPATQFYRVGCDLMVWQVRGAKGTTYWV